MPLPVETPAASLRQNDPGVHSFVAGLVLLDSCVYAEGQVPSGLVLGDLRRLLSAPRQPGALRMRRIRRDAGAVQDNRCVDVQDIPVVIRGS